MAEATRIDTIKLAAGRSSAGKIVYEELPVDKLDDGSLRLKSSPGLVLGLAKGDLIDLLENGQYRLLARGYRVCVHIFTDVVVEFEDMAARIGDLDGTLDGLRDGLVVVSWPVRIGFAQIEASIEILLSELPGADWAYGNVYDPRDGKTPLNWWIEGSG